MSLTVSLVRTAALVGYEIFKNEALRNVEKEKLSFGKMLSDQGVKLVLVVLLRDLMNLFGIAGLIGVFFLVASQGLQSPELELYSLWLSVAGFSLYFFAAIMIYSSVKSASRRLSETSVR